MPITPGSPWGITSTVPDHAMQIDSDRQLGTFLRDNAAQQIHNQTFFVQSGDILKVLGVSKRTGKTNRLRVVIDAISVSYTDADGHEHTDVCIGSLSIARRFFRGAISVITNSGFWKQREVAPRAHPNDGKLDIFEVSGAMRRSQRRLMWQKTALGTHLPHPLLAYSQGEFFNWSGSPQRLTIDGQFVAWVTQVSCRIQSDCVQVYA
ncbi:MAG: hypothetical protein WCI10_00795 [Actinomycetota bacterium]